MNALPPVPPIIVRSPWPDELPRLAEAFPTLRWRRAMHLHVLATGGEIERLVAVSAVCPAPADREVATLSLLARPRFAATAAFDALLAAALGVARERGVRELEFEPLLAPADDRVPALQRAGFALTPVEHGVRARWTRP